MDDQKQTKMAAHNDLNKRLSKALNINGYNKYGSTIKHNEQIMEEFTETFFHNTDNMACGSCAEGTKLRGSSDSDVMGVLKGVSVIECSNESPDEHIKLKMKHDGCGFVKLLVHSNQEEQFAESIIAHSVSEYNDTRLLSSELFNKNIKDSKKLRLYGTRNPRKFGSARVTISGPAVTCGNIDEVCALKCNKWPTAVIEWLNRKRTNNWPSSELLEHLHRNVKCHVVPTGDEISEECRLQWKLSFAAIERELIWSMNDTQLKCFVVLKMILKQVISPKLPEEFKDEIKTYHMKTNVFWLCENLKEDDWREDNLVGCVEKALKKLLECVTERKLSQYIIPTNNLFRNRLMKRDIQESAISIVCLILKTLEATLKEITSGIETTLLGLIVQENTRAQSKFVSYSDFCNYILYVISCVRVSKAKLNEFAKVFPNEFDEGKLYVPCIRLAIAKTMYRDIVNDEIDRDLKVSKIVKFLETGCDMDSMASIIQRALIYIMEQKYDSAKTVLELGMPKHGVKFCVGGSSVSRFITLPTATLKVEHFDRLNDIEKDRHKLITDIVFTKSDVEYVPDSMKLENLAMDSRSAIYYHPLVIAYFLRFLSEYHLGLLAERKTSLLLLGATVMNTKYHVSFHSHINLLGVCYKMIDKKEMAFQWFCESLKANSCFENAAWYHVACMVNEMVTSAWPEW